MEKVGKDGVITVEESKTFETTTDFVEGMQFDRGYLSSYFCNDRDTMTSVLEDAFILIYDSKISSIKEILPILEKIAQTGKALLIIAEDVEGEALSSLVINTISGVLKVVAIKAPGFGEKRNSMLEDIAILTGGTLISAELGMSLNTAEISQLGRAKKIVVTQENTTIVGGAGKKADLEDRVSFIRKSIYNATSDYDKEKLQERLAKLSGGVAVINVGALTEVELKEKKHRVEDALSATRAAIEEGVIPGGGSTLVKVSQKMLSYTNDELTEEEKIGYSIVRRALEEPIRKIAENAGVDGSIVSNECRIGAENIGFDARTLTYVDMIEAGIIDPTKVTRSALQNAASIAQLILTTECTITNIQEKEQKQTPVMTDMTNFM